MAKTGDAARWLREEPAARAALRGRVLRPYRVRQFARFGASSVIDRPTWIYGGHKIAIGDAVLVLPGAWLSAERITWPRPDPAITIGDRVALRAGVTISASELVEIGDDVVFGGQCTVVDSDHTWRDGHPNVLHNPVSTAPIRIGAGSWLGDRVTVLKGVTIGERCAIGAHSVVRTDIPDGAVAVGVPARVVGRSAEL